MRRLLAATALSLSLLIPSPARSCDVALVLLVDISSSVDSAEYALQMQGTARALRGDEVLSRIQRGASGYAYIRLVTFAVHASPRTPWARVGTQQELEALSSTIEHMPRPGGGGTHTGRALLQTIPLFEQLPEECDKHVIDVSTDAPSDDPLQTAEAKARAEELGITINAILIEDGDGSDPDNSYPIEYLIEWAEKNLIAGGDSFVVPATFHDYYRALRAKLTTELAGRTTTRITSTTTRNYP